MVEPDDAIVVSPNRTDLSTAHRSNGKVSCRPEYINDILVKHEDVAISNTG